MTVNPRDDDHDPTQAQEAAWDAIVANYGERPQWEDDAPGPAPEPTVPQPRPVHPEHPAGHGRWHEHDGPGEPGDDLPDHERHEERYVPPPPPPLPRTTPQRALAWFGLLGVPAVVLVLLVAGVRLPSLVTTGFTVWFVGGFVFLVASMRRDQPGPDGPDDGAVV